MLTQDIKVGIIGVGFVGTAVRTGLEAKAGIQCKTYDKYSKVDKNGVVVGSSLKDVSSCDIIFLCLPTPFINEYGYDLQPILDVCSELSTLECKSLVVLKSTVEPGTTQKLADRFNLSMTHNPEFLTERTANEDFLNQSYIVVGYTDKVTEEQEDMMYRLMMTFTQNITECSSTESETMKLFANNFYAMKVGIFNEFNLICQKLQIPYENVREMMINFGWINKMHTQVPGPDGGRGWGGNCFIKDTNALLQFSKNLNCPHEILEAAINENKKIRGK